MEQQSPNRSGALRKEKAFLAVVILIIAGLALVSNWLVKKEPRLADAGFKKAKQTINPEELRTWALEMIKRWPDTNGSQTIPISEIPLAVKKLYSEPPEDVIVNGNILHISWGGGFFHWKIDIGDTNFSLPFNSNNPEFPFNFEWVPGIYYTREARWKLQ